MRAFLDGKKKYWGIVRFRQFILPSVEGLLLRNNELNGKIPVDTLNPSLIGSSRDFQ